jgi:hypothetical protein
MLDFASTRWFNGDRNRRKSRFFETLHSVYPARQIQVNVCFGGVETILSVLEPAMFLPLPPEPETGPLAGLEAAIALAAKLHADGTERAVIHRRLLDLGLKANDTTEILAEVTKPGWASASKGPPGQLSVGELEKNVIRQTGRKNMAIGGLICLVGLAVTIGTFALANQGATGSYVIAWGSVVFGAIQFFRGLTQASV